MKNKTASEILIGEIPENSTIMNYIGNDMLEPQKREFEEWISDDVILGDAIEGLKQIESSEELEGIHNSLSLMIDKKFGKKRRKLLQPLKFPLWITLLVTIVLLAVIVGYTLIKMLNN